MAVSGCPELRALEECTPQLETALKRLERGLVHFLNLKEFCDDDVDDKILNPVTLLTEAQRAWELVKWIKHRVKQDPSSYHVLLDRLKQGGNLYQPIVHFPEAEHTTQLSTRNVPSRVGQLNRRVYAFLFLCSWPSRNW